MIKQPTKRRRYSSCHIPTLSKQRRSAPQVTPNLAVSKASLESTENESSENDEDIERGSQFRSIRIGDKVAVDDAYVSAFESAQQIPCKQIAKAWIKAIEPKKQSRFPYNGGDYKDLAIRLYGKKHQGFITTPGWWPPAGCPHTEPDHIKKEGECVHHMFNIAADVLQSVLY